MHRAKVRKRLACVANQDDHLCPQRSTGHRPQARAFVRVLLHGPVFYCGARCQRAAIPDGRCQTTQPVRKKKAHAFTTYQFDGRRANPAHSSAAVRGRNEVLEDAHEFNELPPPYPGDSDDHRLSGTYPAGPAPSMAYAVRSRNETPPCPYAELS